MNDHSGQPLISGNGKKIAYLSNSSSLLPSGKGSVLRDIASGALVRINASTTGVIGNNTDDILDQISYTGKYVLFRSKATNLIDGETMSPSNIFRLYLKDVVNGTTTLVNRNVVTGQDASDGTESMLTSVGVSSDGRFVSFTSSSINLVSGVTDGNPHL